LSVHRGRAEALSASTCALSVVVLVGCGSSGTARTPVQLVAATYARTTATNAKVALVGSVAAAGQSFPLNGTGAFDFAQRLGTIDLTVPQSGTISSRIIGAVTYEKLPPQLARRAGGKPWLKIDPAALARSSGGQFGSLSQSADPTQVLKYLQGASGPVTTVGKENVRGTPTTHYRTQVDVRKAAQQGAFSGAAASSFSKQFGTSTFPLEVWIDKQGRASRTSYSLKPVSGVGSFAFTQELYDFGKADVGTLTAPPADQTTDISRLVGNAPRTAGG